MCDTAVWQQKLSNRFWVLAFQDSTGTSPKFNILENTLTMRSRSCRTLQSQKMHTRNNSNRQGSIKLPVIVLCESTVVFIFSHQCWQCWYRQTSMIECTNYTDSVINRRRPLCIWKVKKCTGFNHKFSKTQPESHLWFIWNLDIAQLPQRFVS